MERVLVVLPNWYGETLFAIPLLKALRQQRPEAFIAAMGWPQCQDILLHSRWINQFVVYDELDAHRTFLGRCRLVAALRQLRCDTAIVLRRSLSRSLLVWAAGIRRRIGFANAKSGWALTDRIMPSTGRVHKAASYLPLLGVPAVQERLQPYDYTVTPQEQQEAHVVLQAAGVAEAAPLVILHPGANWPHKRWPAERFAALGDMLAQRHGAKVLISGGPADVDLANAVTSAMRQPPVRLAGRTTLRQFAACLERAHLFVSNDTGVVHLAAALGRPVVALYGPTDPAITGPLGDPRTTVVIHHRDSCPQIPCYHPDDPPHAGMNAITVEEVYDAARRLFAQPAAAG